MTTLAVIPARGGSKSIPRKNLRLLGGRPLIAWAIQNAFAAGIERVVVSTDDDAIASVAEKWGAEIRRRPASLGEDHVTLDPVVADALTWAETGREPFRWVVTLQPTSPLLQVSSLSAALDLLRGGHVDTVLSVVDATHLMWRETDRGLEPDYETRLNRQELPRRYKETGAFLAARRDVVNANSRFGPRVDVIELKGFEAVDIDSADDWLMVEAALARRRIAFLPIGSRLTGLGHVTRVITLLEMMTAQQAHVFVDPEEELAIKLLEDRFIAHTVVKRADRLQAIRTFAADIVVHDELNTEAQELQAERALGMSVVTFEDEGAGLQHADLVINALYPEARTDVARRHFFGPQYCCLRDEFLQAKPHALRDPACHILLTFGGTDPGHLTTKVLAALGTEGGAFSLTVIAGRGCPTDELEQQVAALQKKGRAVELLTSVEQMSVEMARADIAFSSAGRTLYELAAMQVPTVVLAQNELELRHTFAAPENGFLFLGLGADVSDAAISGAFRALFDSLALRRSLVEQMAKQRLVEGRARVTEAILALPAAAAKAEKGSL